VEGIDRRHLVRIELRPDPAGAAEIGDAALGADSCAGERDARLLCANEFCEHDRLVHGFSFATEVRVRFAETDAQGIAHNSNYFVWFEVARVEYLERYAGGYQRLRDLGIEAVVLETHVRYLEPARFDDRLRVHARCRDVKGARFRYEYAVERDGTLLADGWTAHATVDAGTMRPTRVPRWLTEAISTAEAA
jgi:acyl-CoA thioester hydrolase